MVIKEGKEQNKQIIPPGVIIFFYPLRCNKVQKTISIMSMLKKKR